MSEFVVAVHSLVYLGHNQESFTSEELAANVCTNPVRIRRVLAKCKQANLISTKRGINGGYYLPHKLEDFTLKEVYSAVQVPLIQQNWQSGDSEASCLVSSGMADVMDEVFEQLNQTAVEQLSHITLKQMENRLMDLNTRRNAIYEPL